MTFAALAWVDTFELAASLRGPRVGLFPKSGECRILPLRGPKRDADPEDDATFVRFFTKWPELTNLLDELRRIAGGGVEYGRIYLEMLMPTGIIPWEHDTSGYAQRFQRVHVAVRTNPNAYVFIAGAAVNMQPGIVNLVDRRYPISAINMGTSWRCHLIVDFRKKTEDET